MTHQGLNDPNKLLVIYLINKPETSHMQPPIKSAVVYTLP